MGAPKFWEGPEALSNLARLVEWMAWRDELAEDADGGGGVVDGIVYMLRKPWKYTPEWEAMQEAEAALLDENARMALAAEAP